MVSSRNRPCPIVGGSVWGSVRFGILFSPVPKQPTPIVVSAVLCEKVLQEKDNVISIIRIIDTLTTEKPIPPDTTTPMLLTLFVSLRSGSASGEHRATMEVRRPSGLVKKVETEWTAQLPSDPLGLVNFVIALPVIPNEVGVYTVDVLWDGEPIASVPFKLLQPLDSSTAAPPKTM